MDPQYKHVLTCYKHTELLPDHILEFQNWYTCRNNCTSTKESCWTIPICELSRTICIQEIQVQYDPILQSNEAVSWWFCWQWHIQVGKLQLPYTWWHIIQKMFLIPIGDCVFDYSLFLGSLSNTLWIFLKIGRASFRLFDYNQIGFTTIY